MSDHKTSLVPVATGYFQSPELFSKGMRADIGLFAESLVYYNSVYVHVDNPEQFAEFIGLLFRHGLTFRKLIELIEEGTLNFFVTGLIMPFMERQPNVVKGLYFIQEQGMLKPNYFAKKYLEFPVLRSKFLNHLDYKKFCSISENNSVVFSDNDFGDFPVKNAYKDCLNPKRFKIIVKNLFKELYRINNLGDVPDFEIKITELDLKDSDNIEVKPNSLILGNNSDADKEGYRVFEFNYSELLKPIPSLEDKNKIASLLHSPLSLAGISNLYVKTASNLDCDLFLSKPVSQIVGNKLFESSQFEISRNKLEIQTFIENLQTKVEFPDLRFYINSKQIKFDKVLEIRQKARFQDWLQTETERDVQEIVARHKEVSKETNLVNFKVEKKLKMYGILGLIHYSNFKEDFQETIESKKNDTQLLSTNSNPPNPENFVESVGEKLLKEWNPVCFGDWLREEISLDSE